MNQWSHLPAVKCTALMAALALGITPVDLLAACGCSACGCAAAVEDSPGCCCIGKSHASDCCGPAADSCCQPAAAPVSDGCSCTQSVPTSPTGMLPNSRSAKNTPVHLAAMGFLPPNAPCDSGFSLAHSDHELYQAVPARVLFCVWRI